MQFSLELWRSTLDSSFGRGGGSIPRTQAGSYFCLSLGYFYLCISTICFFKCVPYLTDPASPVTEGLSCSSLLAPYSFPGVMLNSPRACGTWFLTMPGGEQLLGTVLSSAVLKASLCASRGPRPAGLCEAKGSWDGLEE